MTTNDTNIITRVLGWLRAGYPEGVPPRDYFPLLALLRNSLTADEVHRVLTHLGPGAADRDNIAAAITHVTNQPPTDDEILHVAARLAAGGWPLATIN